jgi:hypothetical protein
VPYQPCIARHRANAHSVGDVIIMGNPPPSDNGTHAAKDESEASEGGNEDQGTPRSLYTVTATEPADFFEVCWGSQECVDERPFEFTKNTPMSMMQMTKMTRWIFVEVIDSYQ